MPITFQQPSIDPAVWSTPLPLVVQARCKTAGQITTWLALRRLLAIWKHQTRRGFGVREIAAEARIGKSQTAMALLHLVANELIYIAGKEPVPGGRRPRNIYSIDLQKLDISSAQMALEYVLARGATPFAPAEIPTDQLSLLPDLAGDRPPGGRCNQESSESNGDRPPGGRCNQESSESNGDRPPGGRCNQESSEESSDLADDRPPGGHEEEEEEEEGDPSPQNSHLLQALVPEIERIVRKMIAPEILAAPECPPSETISMPAAAQLWSEATGSEPNEFEQRQLAAWSQEFVGRPEDGTHGAYWVSRAILAAGLTQNGVTLSSTRSILARWRRDNSWGSDVWERRNGSGNGKKSTPKPNTDTSTEVVATDPMVSAWEKLVGRAASSSEAAAISSAVNDQVRWRQTLEHWRAHPNWDASKLDNLLDHYRKLASAAPAAARVSDLEILTCQKLEDDEREYWLYRFRNAPAHERPAVLAAFREELSHVEQ